VERFPDGFPWGAATSAHQVEVGNTNNDWSDFARVPEPSAHAFAPIAATARLDATP
jgi:beta-glucosidase/6-phospho-beta-glucosidase/beta-galactosidase